MIYEPNTHQWQVGDLVIHDADAKAPYMLMRVVGYSRAGLVKTRYTNKPAMTARRMRYPGGIYENELRYLHDPARFAIPLEGVPAL